MYKHTIFSPVTPFVFSFHVKYFIMSTSRVHFTNETVATVVSLLCNMRESTALACTEKGKQLIQFYIIVGCRL